jgi:AraC-like DNA-binding protein
VTASHTEAPNHNTTTCYTRYRCRRPECVARANASDRERRRKKREGTYQRYADAAPVRAHVQQILAAGGSRRAIAAHAGVTEKTIRDLLPTRVDGVRMPCRHRMFAENAERILAVPAEDVIPPYAPALGSIRRLRALVADAWPMLRVAPRVGVGSRYVSQLLGRASVYTDFSVRGTTALSVARAYDELRGKRSTQCGVGIKAARYARELAKTRNWPPTRYWDQFPGAIDDPHFTPDYRRTRREIVAEDAHWLMSGSRLSRADAAQRIGVSPSYVDHAFADFPEYAVEVAE